MMHNPHKPLSGMHLLATSCLISLAALGVLQGCAHTSNTPKIQAVDRVFDTSEIRIAELQDTVTDIRTRHAGGDITILVRYFLQQPYAASAELAYSQGETVKTYLQEQRIKAPINVIISPISVQPNQIWISYQADMNKGRGIYLQPAQTNAEPVQDIEIKPEAPQQDTHSSDAATKENKASKDVSAPSQENDTTAKKSAPENADAAKPVRTETSSSDPVTAE